jgi:hypothetical protein
VRIIPRLAGPQRVVFFYNSGQAICVGASVRIGISSFLTVVTDAALGGNGFQFSVHSFLFLREQPSLN